MRYFGPLRAGQFSLRTDVDVTSAAAQILCFEASRDLNLAIATCRYGRVRLPNNFTTAEPLVTSS